MNIKKLLSEALSFMSEGEVAQAELLLNKILDTFPKNSDALTQKGIILIHKKQFKKGKNLIQSSLLIKPNQPEALLNLGIAFYQESKFDEAIKYFDDAIKFKPDYSEAFYTKALSYKNKNLIEKAISNFELAILHNPNYIDPIITLGTLYDELNEFDKALNLFKRAEILHPDNQAYIRMIALINYKDENPKESIKYFTRAIQMNLNDSFLYASRASAYIEEEMFDEALIDLNHAIKLDPDEHIYFYNRTIALMKLGLYLEAEVDCKKVLDFKLADKLEESKIFFQLGNINAALKKYDIALLFYNKAINLDSKNTFAYRNKARMFKSLGQFDLARIEYMRLINCHDDPLAMLDASIYFLSQKDFSIGWNAYASRKFNTIFKPTLKLFNEASKHIPQWEGQLDCKSLLILGEQGVGDQIIYLSMLKDLSKKIKKIFILINPKLVKLFERSFPQIHFMPLEKILPNSDSFEYFILLADLGKFLRNSIDSFQSQPNFYLKVNVEKANRFRSKFKTTKLVCGLSWASQGSKGIGAALHMEDAKAKTIFLSDLMPIFNQTNLTYVNLQYGDVKDEIIHFKNNFGVEILNSDNDNYNDLDGLASLIQSCDFVITTSNVTAHIAGALGKKTFVLVNPSMLWYWHDEDVSIWYPSVNIFQKEADGDWRPAIERMRSSVLNYLRSIENA